MTPHLEDPDFDPTFEGAFSEIENREVLQRLLPEDDETEDLFKLRDPGGSR